MRFRWVTLGVIAFAVCLVAVFGVVYVAIELAEDDGTQAIVTGRAVEQIPGTTATGGDVLRRYCVSYSVLGMLDSTCPLGSEVDPPACYLDAEIGKPLPDSCQ